MTVATRTSCKAAAATSGPRVGSFTLPYTTQWHRDNGRGTRRDRAIKQQLLTSRERQTIVDLIHHTDRDGFSAKAEDLHHHVMASTRDVLRKVKVEPRPRSTARSLRKIGRNHSISVTTS